MASLTIRNLDSALKEKLRVRAARRGHSMESEARDILKTALAKNPPKSPVRSLATRIHARFAALGGVDLEIPPREPTRPPPQFD